MAKSDIDILKSLLKTKRKTQVVSKVDEYLMKSAKDRWDGWVHISGLGYPISDQVKGLLGTKKVDSDPRLQRIFGMGHAIHDRYDKYLAGMAEMKLIELIDTRLLDAEGNPIGPVANSKVGIPGVEWEVRDEEDKVTGTADAIIRVNGLNTLIDFKSINSNGFDKIETEAKPEHIWQAKGYTYYFAKTGRCYVDQAMIIYENKDNQELKEIMVNIDDLSDVPKRVHDIWAMYNEQMEEVE